MNLSLSFRSLIPFVISSLLPLIVSSLIVQWIFHHTEFFESPSSSELLIIAFISALLMGLMLSPTTFIAMLNGYLLGWIAIPYVVGAYILASLIGYSIGKLLDQGRVEKVLSQYPKGKRFFENIHISQNQLIFSCRLSPVLPFAFTNVLLASFKAPLRAFLVFGTVGMLPRTLLAIWAGKQASSIYDLNTKEWTLNNETILLLTLIIVSMTLLTLVIRNIYKKSMA